jgi:hypothetical protein
MNAKIDAFVEQIRKRPKFVAASTIDPKWTEQLAAVERLLNAIDRKADDDPATLAILDKVLAVIGSYSSNSATLKGYGTDGRFQS